PPEPPEVATSVVITPTATLVTNRASTSPLIARNPDRGSSASRRPAISAAGRRARRDTSRERAVVSHGPATTSPTMTSRKPRQYPWVWRPVDWGGRAITT